MDFKVGLSAKPSKDKAIAAVASEGEKNLKDALKEVLDEIGMCIENARLIDQRVKEMAGQAPFEIEKKKAEEGNARIGKLARALGFDVEDDEDDEDEDDDATTTASADSDDDGDDEDGGDFSFDDDDEDDSSAASDDSSSDFNFDDDEDDDEDGDSTFSFDDDDDDDDEDDEFNFD